ncbi:MAG: EamA family transporter [Chitinophaga sp.]|uniref:DMT family transporter n=1 Tax=Chitinophaga sp. TaxID=1869181 RepID=UPI001B0FA528|nr:EamA family transporter [Chitinophaga sp.]MBO9727252.1 EamA family transporter [Chitinophaga sp.]
MRKIVLTNRTKGFISIIFVMLIWGSSFSVTKTVVQEVHPYLFAALRHLIAAAVLLPFYLNRRRKIRQSLPMKKLALMGIAGITVYYGLFNFAMTYIPASSGALIEGLIPVAIAIPAALILKEHLSSRSIAGIILCVTGVILVGFVGAPDGSSHTLIGSGLMALAVCCWSVYTLLSRSIKETDTLLSTAVSTFIGTALLLPVAAIDVYNHGMPEISGKAWAGIIYLGVFASALAYFLYNQALESLPAAQVGNFLNLNPVIGAIIAIIFLKDTFTAWQMTGGVLVLAGIWLSSRRVAS